MNLSLRFGHRSVERAGGDGAAAEAPLTPALLIASAIDTNGNLDLPGPGTGRVIFAPDEEGAFRQRDANGVHPIDMTLLRASMTRAFGDRTPALFQVASAGTPACRLRLEGPRHDAHRLEILQNAFSIYLLAYEEGLI